MFDLDDAIDLPPPGHHLDAADAGRYRRNFEATLAMMDLVICGKQAIDGDTAQVGPGIAAHLDLPQATNASAMGEVTPDAVQVTRMHEDGFDVCELEMPAVITVVKGKF